MGLFDLAVFVLFAVVLVAAGFGLFFLVGQLAHWGVRGLCRVFRSDRPARIYHTIRRCCWTPFTFVYGFLPWALICALTHAAVLTYGHARTCYAVELAETCEGLDLNRVRYARVVPVP